MDNYIYVVMTHPGKAEAKFEQKSFTTEAEARLFQDSVEDGDVWRFPREGGVGEFLPRPESN